VKELPKLYAHHMFTTANGEIARLVETAHQTGETTFADLRGMRFVAQATGSLREDIDGMQWTFWMLRFHYSVVTATCGERNVWQNLVRELPSLREQLVNEFTVLDYDSTRATLQWMLRLSLLTWHKDGLSTKRRSAIIDTLDECDQYSQWYDINIEKPLRGTDEDVERYRIMQAMRHLSNGKFPKQWVEGINAWLRDVM